MVKVSVNRYVSRRMETLRIEVEADTRRIREKALNILEEIFRAAARMAKGEIGHQRRNGKMVHVSLKERRMWLRLAEQAAQTIKTIASNFNEQEVNHQLTELEKLINEINTESRQPADKPATSPFKEVEETPWRTRDQRTRH